MACCFFFLAKLFQLLVLEAYCGRMIVNDKYEWLGLF